MNKLFLLLFLLLINNVCFGMTFQNCSDDAEKTITAAVAQADFQVKAIMYSNDPKIFIKWFGFNEIEDIKDNYRKIYFILNDRILNFNCSCSYEYNSIHENYYAYVLPYTHYNINICKLFWQTTLTGYNSQSGTIIHEISHFSDAVSSKDIELKYEDCLNLAKLRMGQYIAMINANNYEYMAEDLYSSIKN